MVLEMMLSKSPAEHVGSQFNHQSGYVTLLGKVLMQGTLGRCKLSRGPRMRLSLIDNFAAEESE